jgi:hypothetical protein
VSGKSSVAAECIYWDATGGFTLRTVEGDVPVEVVLELIAEARKSIRVR